MDAILIAISTKRELHFLVRSDVFNTPFKRWFFKQLNMMPIYRIRDGREALKINDSIFLKCRKVLENNGAIVIFPEGNCIVKKRLRAFKTGFVHLAFNTPVQNLAIVPIAINYSRPDEFYTDASLSFLDPISVNEIRLLAGNQEFDFNKLLMSKTHEALKEHMVYIPEHTDDAFFEAVLEMKRNSKDLTDVEFVSAQRSLVTELTDLKTVDSSNLEIVKIQVKGYSDRLLEEGVTDSSIADAPVSVIQLGLRFPFYFLGYLLNILPAVILEKLVNTKIKEKQFKSSVRMVLSLFFYTAYISLISFLLNFAFQNYLFSLAVIVSLMLSYYASFSLFNIFKQQQKIQRNSSDFNEIKTLRLAIVEELNL